MTFKEEIQWWQEKARAAEIDVRYWMTRAKDEERRRTALEEEVFRLRNQAIVSKRENDELRRQVDELFPLTNQLEDAVKENKRLAKELNKRNGTENPYGLGTPSSKRVDKKNSSGENQKKRGGAKKGHRGKGRKGFSKDEADRTVELDTPPDACGCGVDQWYYHSTNSHCVINYVPAKIEKVYYGKTTWECSGCGNLETTSTPGVAPGSMYSDRAIANMLVEHYLHGHTVGELERRWGVNCGTFFNFAHDAADKLLPVFDSIISDLRVCLVIHADETPWSMDGKRGYAWFFGNDDCKIFIFRHTRGSEVPLTILGTDELKGTLVTDRYSGYVSVLKIGRQYCLVHIIRDVKKEEAGFPEDEEVARFAADLKPLLAEAVSLRNQKVSVEDYLARAAELQKEIMKVCESEAEHPAVQHIQNIFREEPERLFQWVSSPDVPADNNYSERELRPIVIARKISFGSQSERGLKTREILMTVAHTAKCRGRDPAEFIEKALALLRREPDADLSKFLQPSPKGSRRQERAA